MARFFVPQRDVVDGKARLQGGEFRHLQRVLRLREGDAVTLFDDAGIEHEGVIISLSPRVATVRITALGRAGARVAARRHALPGRAQGPEDGPHRREGDRARRRRDRAVRVGVRHRRASPPRGASASAGSASRSPPPSSRDGRRSPRSAPRSRFPRSSTAAAAHGSRAPLLRGRRRDAAAAGRRPTPTRRRPPPSSSDPEGGFSRRRGHARAATPAFVVCGLGPRVLRTETAALVATALVQARWGDLDGDGDAPIAARRLVCPESAA